MLQIQLSKVARVTLPVAVLAASLSTTTGCDEVLEEVCFEQTGVLTQVTTDTLTTEHYDAALSPDGTRIAFTSDYWSALPRFVDNGNKIFGQPDFGVISVPQVGEDRDPVGEDQLWRIGGYRINLSGLVDERGEIVNTIDVWKSGISWVDDDRLALVVENSFFRDRIFVVSLGDTLPNFEIRGNVEQIIEEDRLVDLIDDGRLFFNYRDPTVSPDGQWIAYARSYTDFGSNPSDPADDDIEPQAIFAFNLQDSRIVRVTNGSSRENQPTWSPDGRSIAFVSNQGTASLPEIFRVGFDPDDPAEARSLDEPITDGRRRLTASTGNQLKLPEYNQEPAWLANGLIVYTSTRRVPCSSQRIRNLWVMNSDGSDQRPFVVSREDDNFAATVTSNAASPEATNTIVFSSRRNRVEGLVGQKMDLWVLRNAF